jgi:hypothetical protein
VIASLALARSLERECSGAPGEALAALTSCITANHAEQLQVEMEALLPDAVRLAVGVGDLSTATELITHADILTRRSTVAHRAATALYCRGLLDRDPGRLLLAAKHYGESGRPLPRAKATEAAAIAIADSRPVAEASATFDAANAIYTSLGARRDIDRLRATSHRYGLSLLPTRQRIEDAEA